MQQNIPSALLELTDWDQLSLFECEQLARYMETLLPSPFRFTHMATYEVGTQRHHIAHFAWQPPSEQTPSLFSLIPGGTVLLGFDQTHPFVVDQELVLDWQRYCLEYEKDLVGIYPEIAKEPQVPHYDTFYRYLATLLHPLRRVTLQPLLVEVMVQEAEKVIPSRQRGPIPQHRVVSWLKTQGFRLLTADEWEYVCAAGSRTLFYWVNEQFEWNAVASSWEELRNAFGLAIAQDTIAMDVPYHWEYCADPTMMKGGDGGRIIGCETAFLSLASAYYLPLTKEQIGEGVHGPCFRRVYDLRFPFERGASTRKPLE